jgi:hypothetical protein
VEGYNVHLAGEIEMMTAWQYDEAAWNGRIDNKLHRLQKLTYRVDAASNPIPLLPFSPQNHLTRYFKVGKRTIYEILILIWRSASQEIFFSLGLDANLIERAVSYFTIDNLDSY